MKHSENRHIVFNTKQVDLTVERLESFGRMLTLPLVTDWNHQTQKDLVELKVPVGLLWLETDPVLPDQFDFEGKQKKKNEMLDASSKTALKVVESLARKFAGINCQVKSNCYLYYS